MNEKYKGKEIVNVLVPIGFKVSRKDKKINFDRTKETQENNYTNKQN